MKWADFIQRWMSEVGEQPPKAALTEWMEFVTGNSGELMRTAITAVAERYAAAKDRDGAYAKAPTLWELRRAYGEAAKAHKKELDQQSNGCDFCRSVNRLVMVLDVHLPGVEYPPDPATWTGSRAYIATIPCPECRAAEYGAREALRQRVKHVCVREDEREKLYESPTATAMP